MAHISKQEQARRAKKHRALKYYHRNSDKINEARRKKYANPEMREAHKRRKRAWHLANPEKGIEYRRKHDPEKLREYARNYYIANREKINEASREWSANNREKVRERNRKWYASHRKQVAEIGAKYRADNPEKVREARRKSKQKWIAANPEKHHLRQLQTRRRRAILISAARALIPPEILQQHLVD